MEYFLFEFIISPCAHIPPVSSDQIVYDQAPCSSELLRDLRFVQCSPKYYYCGSAPVRPCSPLNVVIIQMRLGATNANTNQPQTEPYSYFILQRICDKNVKLQEGIKQETFIERIKS